MKAPNVLQKAIVEVTLFLITNIFQQSFAKALLYSSGNVVLVNYYAYHSP